MKLDVEQGEARGLARVQGRRTLGGRRLQGAGEGEAVGGLMTATSNPKGMGGEEGRGEMSDPMGARTRGSFGLIIKDDRRTQE